jgi:hypothetical protein
MWSSRKIQQLLAIALCVSARCNGQDLPRAASAHKFWDAPNKTLFASHAFLEALDFGITHHNLSAGGREMDAVAKPFCERGTAGQAVFFGGRMAGVVAVGYLLHKTGHHKLERLFPLYASGDSAYGVVYSFVHR